ncbi:hypothetical protein WJX73_003321 [Symbiochloris irregularis]|uniref:Chitinase domain-containing protein 1 n=1 Tax=Symbiochloris irregularis TaxID=706552 RepID=A0AAW1PYJ3_9CHLO
MLKSGAIQGLALAWLLCQVSGYDTGPTNENIWDKGLVSPKTDYKSILQAQGQYFEDVEQRNFAGTVLAFVTPWNSKGYDLAKTFAPKLSHVSPVWYQIRLGADRKVKLTGGHDADDAWVEAMHSRKTEGRPSVKVVPRLVIEVGMDEMVPVLMGIKDVSELLIEEALAHNYDGWVFEPSMPGRPALNFADWGALAKISDGVIVMTYDAASPEKPGPNAPLDWTRGNLDALLPAEHPHSPAVATKLLLGLNFFGNHYVAPSGGGPLIGREYCEVLQQHRPRLVWNDKAKEHVLEYVHGGERHSVYYPSASSIKERLDLAYEYGVGISIWELGQGLDMFMDLL